MKTNQMARGLGGLFLLLLWGMLPAVACTGIGLKASDGSFVLARTIEWGAAQLHSELVVIPRGCGMTSYTPSGVNGVRFAAQYGTVGVSLVQKEFMGEGVNEMGLSAGLFYFPGEGRYPAYEAAHNEETLADVQVVTYVLTQCATIDEAIAKLSRLRIVSIDTSGVPATVHWRIGDASGRQVVVELLDGEPHFFENTVGVLTNAPSYPWHVTNLSNYVNLHPGSAPVHTLGGVQLAPFGAGSGFLGLPGDVTPPSRFVRAAFFLATAPVTDSAERCVSQAFQILSCFNIPIGFVNGADRAPDIPSATQWTSVTDVTHRRFYYRTMYNAAIRCVNLAAIDFEHIKYQALPLDVEERTPVEVIAFTRNAKEEASARLKKEAEPAPQCTDSLEVK